MSEIQLSSHIILKIAAAAFLLNVISFAVFAWDKRCARRQAWRVSERTLLYLAALGGSVGAVSAQIFLRHKTRKQPFGTYLRLIVGLHSVALIILLVPQGREAVWAFVNN